jgi:hypothetical protein
MSKHVNQQPDFFEANDPPIKLSGDQKRRLMPLLQAMLSEIMTPTSEEVGDDEGNV